MLKNLHFLFHTNSFKHELILEIFHAWIKCCDILKYQKNLKLYCFLLSVRQYTDFEFDFGI